MPTIRTVLLCLTLVPPMAVAQSGSIDLLSFATPDAKIIAGANVDAAKNSDFGQFVVAQIQSGNPALQKFIQDTGVDPRSDISEVLVVTDGTPGPGLHALVAAHGTFSHAIGVLEAAATANGGTVTHIGGVDLIQLELAPANTSGQNPCVAFYTTDAKTALIGDCGSVQAAIKSAGPKPSTGTSLLTTAQSVRSQQDLWFTSVLPMGEFANAVPGGLNGVMNSALIQAIQQTSGGVKFISGSTSPVPSVQLSGDALMDTPQNATSLMNVVNFFVSMIQMNHGPIQVPAALQSLLGSFQVSANGSTLHVSMTVTQAMLEQLFQQMHQQASTERDYHERHHRETVAP